MNIGPNIGQSFRLVFTFSQYNTYFAHRIQQPIFKLQTLNFKKYWKVWLAFNGWKLSGLFFNIVYFFKNNQIGYKLFISRNLSFNNGIAEEKKKN